MVSTERYIHTNGKFTILGKREGCNIAVLNLSFNAGLSKNVAHNTILYVKRDFILLDKPCSQSHAKADWDHSVK